MTDRLAKIVEALGEPYYTDGKRFVYCGDSRELLPRLPAQSVDLVLTDIPYGEVNRASGGLRNLDRGAADIETFPLSLVPEQVDRLANCCYVWCGTEQVSDLRADLVEAGFTTRLCVWEKTNPSPMNGELFWLSSIEACVFARRKGAIFNEHCASPVWRGPTEPSALHPTQKPLWLFKSLIRASSNAGDLVLDFCAGSGTTLRAAKDLDRAAIGFEREEAYCEIAANRLRQGVLEFA